MSRLMKLISLAAVLAIVMVLLGVPQVTISIAQAEENLLAGRQSLVAEGQGVSQTLAQAQKAQAIIDQKNQIVPAPGRPHTIESNECFMAPSGENYPYPYYYIDPLPIDLPTFNKGDDPDHDPFKDLPPTLKDLPPTRPEDCGGREGVCAGGENPPFMEEILQGLYDGDRTNELAHETLWDLEDTIAAVEDGEVEKIMRPREDRVAVKPEGVVLTAPQAQRTEDSFFDPERKSKKKLRKAF